MTRLLSRSRKAEIALAVAEYLRTLARTDGHIAGFRVRRTTQTGSQIDVILMDNNNQSHLVTVNIRETT